MIFKYLKNFLFSLNWLIQPHIRMDICQTMVSKTRVAFNPTNESQNLVPFSLVEYSISISLFRGILTQVTNLNYI